MSYKEQIEDVICETVNVTSPATGTVPVIVEGFVGQTANLTTWRDSSDTTQGGFTAKGQLLAFGPTNSITNVAIGETAMDSNASAVSSTAVGYRALWKMTGGLGSNVAVGRSALANMTTGSGNVALGFSALGNIGTDINNIAIGSVAMLDSAASNCVAIGASALKNSTGGANSRDIAIGIEASQSKTGGISNVCIGFRSGRNSSLVAGGYSNNVFIGFGTGTNIIDGANSNILIGKSVTLPVAGGSNQLSIGDIIYGTGINATTGLIGIHQATPTAFLDLPASIAASASLRLRDGATVSSPNAGDIWNDGTDLVAQINSITSKVSFKNVVTSYTKQQYFGTQTLTDAANISWNLDDEEVAVVTLTANRILDNPTNMADGGTYILRVIQGGAGSFTLSFGAAYVTADDSTVAYTKTLSTAAGSYTTIAFASDGTNMSAS